jgi:hypothetical protein
MGEVTGVSDMLSIRLEMISVLRRAERTGVACDGSLPGLWACTGTTLPSTFASLRRSGLIGSGSVGFWLKSLGFRAASSVLLDPGRMAWILCLTVTTVGGGWLTLISRAVARAGSTKCAAAASISTGPVCKGLDLGVATVALVGTSASSSAMNDFCSVLTAVVGRDMISPFVLGIGRAITGLSAETPGTGVFGSELPISPNCSCARCVSIVGVATVGEYVDHRSLRLISKSDHNCFR